MAVDAAAEPDADSDVEAEEVKEVEEAAPACCFTVSFSPSVVVEAFLLRDRPLVALLTLPLLPSRLLRAGVAAAVASALRWTDARGDAGVESDLLFG